MKLMIILLTTAIVHVSARGLSQTVSFNGKNALLQEVFSAIEKQTGFKVAYNKMLLDKANPVSLNVTDVPLRDFLQLVFREQPFGYSLKNKAIFISHKAAETEIKSIDNVLAVPPTPIRGRVLDADGAPLAGATVTLKAGKVLGVTNAEGVFSVNVSVGDMLVISSVGFEPTDYKISSAVVASSDQQSAPGTGVSLTITLKRKESQLNEVVVNNGYYTESKRFNIGSAATVNSVEIEKHPVSNVLLALQGQVPGLLVTTTSGAPGAAVNLQVRGQNTLYNGNSNIRPYDQPLFIVDGVPMASQNNNINLLGGFQNGGFTYSTGLSPFSTLNPSDIESVTVLKDAGATSIYGSQGSNGVILITTKKGKSGKPQLSINARTGVDIAGKLVTMMNTQQYRAMRMEAFANDGITTVQGNNAFQPNYAPDLTIFDQNKYTDWSNYLMGNSTSNTNIHTSFSGGSNTTNFMISGGLNRQGYNFPGGLSNNVYTFHSGFNYNSPDGRLHVGIITDYAYQDNQASAAASLVRNILTPPDYPDLVDAAGNLIWTYKGISLDAYQTFGALKKVGRTQSHNLNNSMVISYELIRDLKVKLNIGYNRNTSAEIQQNPLSSMSPGSDVSYAIFGNNNFQTINIEPQLDYISRFGKGELSVLIGGTYKKNLNDNSTITGYDYANDALLGSVSGSGRPVTVADGGNIYKYVGAFGRIGYIHDQKYIVSLTGRRDGSSTFGPNRKFGNFGSAGIGWIFSEERPVKTFLPFLSFGKISGSYGTTGSDAVAPYHYQTFWQAMYEPSIFQGARAYEPANIYNPDYSWDVKKTLNTSIDLGFLNDRIMLNATWYQSRSNNQLINANLPYQTGYETVIENSPATVQNSGLEFTLTTVNIKTANFKWTTNFNISRNRNKLLKFPDLATSSYAVDYEIGKPITSTLAFKYKGVNPETGIFEFYTKNGEVTSSPPLTDKELLVDLTPEFYGGLGNVITYKSLSLSFLFQFSKGTTMNWLGALYNQSLLPGQEINLPTAALARWQKPGDIAQLQKFTTNPNALFDGPTRNFINSTGAYSKSTYARLKNVNLSYSMPKGLLKKLSLKGLQVYMNAENLFVISSFKVGDPETAGSLFTLPIQRTIVAGLSFNL